MASSIGHTLYIELGEQPLAYPWGGSGLDEIRHNLTIMVPLRIWFRYHMVS
jgi:hypothetical protein